MSGKGRNSGSSSGAQFGVCSICKDNMTSDINSTRLDHVLLARSGSQTDVVIKYHVLLAEWFTD